MPVNNGMYVMSFHVKITLPNFESLGDACEEKRNCAICILLTFPTQKSHENRAITKSIYLSIQVKTPWSGFVN